jgi:hypothetical protein
VIRCVLVYCVCARVYVRRVCACRVLSARSVSFVVVLCVCLSWWSCGWICVAPHPRASPLSRDTSSLSSSCRPAPRAPARAHWGRCATHLARPQILLQLRHASRTLVSVRGDVHPLCVASLTQLTVHSVSTHTRCGSCPLVLIIVVRPLAHSACATDVRHLGSATP